MPSILQGLLTKFLDQSQAANLKTADYMKSYKGLSIVVSFGKGSLANVPWMAFVSQGTKPSKGVYPVYLLFKQFNILLLAYGESERLRSDEYWLLPEGTKSVPEFLLTLGIKSDKYSKSFVFKMYDVAKSLDFSEMEKDLDLIIQKFKEKRSYILPK
jgi:5-methylcytosine-specific restriction enzyme B